MPLAETLVIVGAAVCAGPVLVGFVITRWDKGRAGWFRIPVCTCNQPDCGGGCIKR